MNTLERNYLQNELRQTERRRQLPQAAQQFAQNYQWINVESSLSELYNYLTRHNLPYEESAEGNYYVMEAYYLLCLFLQDKSRLDQISGALRDKTPQRQSYEEVESKLGVWLSYYQFIEIAANRVLRSATVEDFENALDEIDWQSLDAEMLYKYSTLIGYVYLNEDRPDWQRKCKFWLEKAATEAEPLTSLIIQTFLLTYQIKTLDISTLGFTEKSLENFKLRIGEKPEFKPMESAAEELTALLQMARQQFERSDHARIANYREIIETLQNRIEDGAAPDQISRIHYLKSINEAYLMLENEVAESEKGKYRELSAKALDRLGKAADATDHAAIIADYHLTRATSMIQHKNWKDAGKQLSEALVILKKNEHLPNLLACYRDSARINFLNEKPDKGLEETRDGMRYGLRIADRGGFYIVLGLFDFINEVFMAETHKPGVSWMTGVLDEFFDTIIEVHQHAEANLETIGQEAFEAYKQSYINFGEVSNYNIKTYFRYQWQAVKVVEISALLNRDALGAQIARITLDKWADDNNPLHFIEAGWKEFKEVPNGVRNKTINKCISITKADLPAAADHLDFSYRNLRSYITYKEVNRLGFFLDEQDTDAYELEKGIRLMFYDLYLSGKIFEVVFDLPRFLVIKANTGFHAGEMERELNIKYNTAKKYLKIMTEMGLVELDKSEGKKNRYRISKERILARYEQEEERLKQQEAENA